ncbi:MAG: sigma-70 family RNA polymerase sigma factor [Xanthomonadales bacterium]|nr:sigma-70 family RNA polymerase sigma factor [Xanthomonadales bacterium]MCB1634135.1 sigma-70 family RNA polymerase sigma factor [Xanthomonadales bacterium]MCB1641629.1 sigma-70 family RNA polymerase sigma factor [Xanthomonadales bacterium]
MESRQRFDTLVRTYSTELYRYAYWLCQDEALSKDLVQETFLRAWRSIAQLRDVAAAKSWLITIVRREHARLYERKRLPTDDIDDIPVEDGDSPEPAALSDVDTIRAAMARLPTKYREPLVLQVVMGMSCREIAEELQISESAVMTQLFRARQKLQEQLLPSEDDERVA